MSESKKILVVIGVFILLILGSIGFVYAGGQDSKEIYEQFIADFNGEENKLVYLGSSTCGYCSLLNPSLQDMSKRYEFDYLYIDINEMSSSYVRKVINELGLTSVGTPYLAIVSNGKVVDTQNGYDDYNVVFEFLQENNVISEDAELDLNYIDYETYEKLLASKDKEVIVVGQTTCGYCVQAKVILNDVASEHEVEINYIDIAKLDEEDREKFLNSLDYFQEDEWGTPIMMIVQDGEVVDMIEQLATEDEYVEFLQENEVIE